MLAEIFLLPKDFSRVVENLSYLYFEIITMSNNSVSIISRTIAHRVFLTTLLFTYSMTMLVVVNSLKKEKDLYMVSLYIIFS